MFDFSKTLLCLVTISAAGMAQAGGEHGHHHHEPRAIPAGAEAPTVSLHAMEDTMSGFNLHIMTSHFTFSPANTGKKTDAVEGHVHLYINGEKQGRVYSDWVHIGGKLLGEGENTIRVTLNDNMHSDWTVDGEPVAAEITVIHGEKGDHSGHMLKEAAADHSGHGHSSHAHGEHKSN